MKNVKKLVMAVTALTMCASSAFAVTACNNEHTHSYTWTVTTDPTCEQDGVETGICEADGDVTTRPIAALGHKYGDWQIIKPTAGKEGLAKKVCSADGGHVINVTLPKLTADGTGYKKVEETATQSGVPSRTYTFSSAEYGEIKFSTVSVVSVDEAVKVGAEFDDNVVSGKISLNSATSRSINSSSATPGGPIEVLVTNEKGEREVWLVPQNTDSQDYTTVGKKLGIVDDELSAAFRAPESEPFFKIGDDSEIIYEFGENYVHLRNDAERTEGFYDFDEEGKLIFPVSTLYVGGGTTEDGDPLPESKLVIKDEGATDEYLKGFGFGFTYYNIEEGAKFYGAGAFVTKLYEYAKISPNKDFTETITEEDGKTVYSFSFGQYHDGFHLISVKFTLDDDYVIDWAELECRSYRTTDWNPDLDLSTANVTVTKNADGTYTVNEGHEAHWKEYECFTLTQKTSLGDDPVPVNPYKLEDMLISSYDWEITSGATADSADPSKFNVSATSPVVLQFKNIVPETYNAYFDEINIYERVYSDQGSQTDSQGRKYDDVALSNQYSGGDDGHILVYFHRVDHNLTLTSYTAGEHTLVLKTENTEKIFSIDVPFVAPKNFIPDVYSYDEVKEEGLWVHSDVNADVTVYAGQTLYFNSFVDHPAYESAEYTSAVTKGTGATLDKAMLEGKEVSTFVAETAGAYTITLSSSLGGLQCTVNVVVAPAPEVSGILNGGYWNFDNEDDTVAFTPSGENALDGTATLNVTLGKTELKNVAFNYSYDASAKEFTLSNVPEQFANLELGFKLTSAYNLFLTYKDSFGDSQQIYLINATPNNLTGSYVMAGSVDSAAVLTANVAGNYTITLPAGQMAFYKVNDGANKNNMDSKGWSFQKTFVVRLTPGDTIKIWSTVIAGQIFSITCEDLSLPTSITLDKTQLTAALNNNYSLKATLNPEADITDVVWSSSDETVAKVSATGAITLLKEGEVTITCAAKYNPEVKAECTLTVINNAVTGVNLDKNTETIKVGGDTVTLTPTLVAETAGVAVSNKNVTWSSSDETIARVSANGVVTALKSGKVTITVTTEDGGYTADCEFDVQYIGVTSVTLDKTNETVYLGNGTLKLTATVGPEDASDKSVEWSSSDETVATVDQSGVVTFIKTGSVTVTCTSSADGTKKATCAVEVLHNAVASVTLSSTTAKTYIGSTTKLTATLKGEVEDKSVSNKNVTWSSSDETVATVDANGVVTGIKEGTATITVTTEDGNKTAQCEVTVTIRALNEGNNNLTFTRSNPRTEYRFTGVANAEYQVTFSLSNTNRNGPTAVTLEYPGYNATIGGYTKTAKLTADSDGNITFYFSTNGNWQSYWGLSVSINRSYPELEDTNTLTFTGGQETAYAYFGEANTKYNFRFTTTDAACNFNFASGEDWSDSLVGAGSKIATLTTDSNGKIILDFKANAGGDVKVEVGLALDETYTTADDVVGLAELVFIGTAGKEYNVNIDAGSWSIGEYKVAGAGDPIENDSEDATNIDVKVTADSDGKIVISLLGDTSVTVTEA